MAEPNTRDRILDAAEATFADAGFAAARVAAIADAAGVNKAMLYYYFGSKSELYQAVMERTFDRIAEMAEDALAAEDAPPEERVRLFLRGYFEILMSRPRFPRMMIREILDGGANLLPVLVARMQRPLAAFVRAVNEGQSEGALNPKLDPAHLPMILISPFIVYSNLSPIFQAFSGLDASDAQARFEETALSVMLDGLLTASST